MRSIAVALLAITAAPPYAQGTLVGVVREDSTGRPVASADIVIDALQLRTRTDSLGRFRLARIPAGLHQVQARRLGYTPAALMIRLQANETRENDLTLTPIPVSLSAVTVNARRDPSGPPEEFDDRRALGLGIFIGPETLRETEHLHTEDVLRRANVNVMPMLVCRLSPNTMREDPTKCRPDPLRAVLIDNRRCPMRVYLDGALVYRGPTADKRTPPEWGDMFDINSVSIMSLAGIEIYKRASQMPGAYAGTGASCGVALLWTRR